MNKKIKKSTSHVAEKQVETIKILPTIFDRLYLFLLICIPLCYFPKAVDPTLVPRQFLLSVFSIVVGINIWRIQRKKEIGFDFSFLKLPIVLVYSAFLILVLISFVQCRVISEGFYVFSKYLNTFVFFLITSFLLINKLLNKELLVRSVFWMSLIFLVIALGQFMTMDLTTSTYSEATYTVVSTNGHKNLFASCIFLMFPFVLLKLNRSESGKKGFAALLLLFVLLVWLVQSRAVIIGFLLFALVLGFYSVRKGFAQLNKMRIILVISVGVLVGTLTWFNRATFSHLTYGASVAERITLWENTIPLVKDNFWTGVGAGNWQIYFSANGLNNFEIDNVKNGLTTFQRPHNDFLWVLSENGIIGLLLYALLFILVIAMNGAEIRRTTDKKKKQEAVILLATIIGYLFIALVDFPLERIEHQLVLMLVFAFTVSNYYKSRAEEGSNGLMKFFLSSCIIFAGFSLFISFKRIQSEVHTQNLYGMRQLGNWKGLIEEANLAQSYWYQVDAMTTPIEWYKGIAYFSLNQFETGKQAFEKAYEINPSNIHVMNNLASTYEKLGNHKKAIHFYKKVLHYSLHFDEAILNLAAVYYNLKNYEDAFVTINLCAVDCSHPKYRNSLIAIVSEKVRRKSVDLKSKIEIIKVNRILENDENLIDFYKEFRAQNKNFDLFFKQWKKKGK